MIRSLVCSSELPGFPTDGGFQLSPLGDVGKIPHSTDEPAHRKICSALSTSQLQRILHLASRFGMAGIPPTGVNDSFGLFYTNGGEFPQFEENPESDAMAQT